MCIRDSMSKELQDKLGGFPVPLTDYTYDSQEQLGDESLTYRLDQYTKMYKRCAKIAYDYATNNGTGVNDYPLYPNLPRPDNYATDEAWGRASFISSIALSLNKTNVYELKEDFILLNVAPIVFATSNKSYNYTSRNRIAGNERGRYYPQFSSYYAPLSIRPPILYLLTDGDVIQGDGLQNKRIVSIIQSKLKPLPSTNLISGASTVQNTVSSVRNFNEEPYGSLKLIAIIPTTDGSQTLFTSFDDSLEYPLNVNGLINPMRFVVADNYYNVLSFVGDSHCSIELVFVGTVKS